MKDKREDGELDVGRDLLDTQLLDRNDQSMGKVDGVIAELEPGQPPRLVFLEQGGPVPWRRLNQRLGDWVERWGERWSVTGGKAYRIPWDKVREVGLNIRVDVDAAKTPALAWENWLRDHVIGRIPGAGSGR